MCFGIRISSPFHLNTLNIPIQNIKCPKNTKNACADIIFSPAIICEAWTVSSLHKHAKPNLCDRQCYPWITLFGAMLCAGICDQRWKWLQSFVISSSKHEMCSHVFHLSSLYHFRAQSQWLKGDGMQEVKITLFNKRIGRSDWKRDPGT